MNCSWSILIICFASLKDSLSDKFGGSFCSTLHNKSTKIDPSDLLSLYVFCCQPGHRLQRFLWSKEALLEGESGRWVSFWRTWVLGWWWISDKLADGHDGDEWWAYMSIKQTKITSLWEEKSPRCQKCLFVSSFFSWLYGPMVHFSW